ncbi:unnamed protein product [Clonostachys rosea f. rosea IK726]|uniref:Uncharacterized protein n=2 Tax=Bionectria ochroleuca TaxID=29856 RepID=A0A0B7KI66_BIOOC|nr:unnamed protein product [Clonostachys rosea f. rosea IK726]
MAQGSVSYLSVPGSALPVYEVNDGHATMFWSSLRGDYQDLKNNSAQNPLIRVIGLGDNVFDIGFDITLPPDAPPTNLECFTLSGNIQPFGGAAGDVSVCAQTNSVSIDSLRSTVSISLSGCTNYLPWGLRGEIKWAISNLESTYPTSFGMPLGSTFVEIYFVSTAKLPDFLFRGLPIEFFRKFFLPLQSMNKDPDIGAFNDPSIGRYISDDEQGWKTYVIEKLHYQPNIRYNSFGGGEAQYFNGGIMGNSLSFGQWCNNLSDGKTHVINCYDLAALVQTILPLGLQDARCLYMKRMAPFGYINTSLLIGRGECNSPLGTPFVTTQNDPKRTGFGSHIFMTIADDKVTQANGSSEKVLDATCRPMLGPPHAGQETISDYFNNSVDATTTLYSPTTIQHGNVTSPPRTSPYNWTGVTSLKTPPEFFAMDKLLAQPIPKESDILDGVTNIFASNWTLETPTFDLTSKQCTATWLLTNKTTQEVMNLTITRFMTIENAQKQYTKRVERFTDDNGIELSSDLTNAPAGLKQIWADVANYSYVLDPIGALLWSHYNFLIVMSNDSNPQGLVQYASQIGALVDQAHSAAVNSQPLSINGGKAEDLQFSYSAGDQFEVTVDGGDRGVIDLQFTGTSVLYMSSSKNDNVFTFTFLCRTATPINQWDIISFSTFDASLDKPKPRNIYVEIM